MAEQDHPFLTASLPGIGGRIRTTPEDFQVEEKPLYVPCGAGEHLYLKITKRGLSTPDLVLRLASTCGVKAKSIGVAGLKDSRAVTTQMVSIQGISVEDVSRIKVDDRLVAVELLGRHRNRLRTGHHAGNTFHLVVREVEPHAIDTVPLALDILARKGAPNYFGQQRQGRAGQNYQLGAELLTDAARRNRMSRAKRLWYLHAYQSFLFNLIVARRLGRIDQIQVGDWAMKEENGACFLVEDAAAEQPRAARFEISPTGPLFGSRAPWASGEPGKIERDVVAEAGATPEALIEGAKACGFRGERRSLRIRMDDVSWSLKGDQLALSFSLPPGAYATSVLRELMKIGEGRGIRGEG
ncbi:MAG: tRNA pseudouridine(13) synthase TruD [Nitrospiraceae bacterium]